MVLSAMPHLKRPRPVAFVVALVLVWLALGVVAVALRRGPIERDLARRATDAVHRTGATRAEVTIAGTTATLHGDFTSPSAARAALAAARVHGVSSTRLGADALVATRPAQPVVLAVDGGRLTVRATVPDGARRAALLGDITAAGGALTSQITVDPRAAAPALPPLTGLLTALTRVPGTHTLTVDGDRLVLRGTVADADGRASLGTAVLTAGRTGGARVVLDNQLVVAAAAPRPAGGDAAALAAAGGHPVTFAPDSSALSDADRVNLDAVVGALRAGTQPVLVAGYTDSTGPDAVNQSLSLGRARAAVDYLVGKGVPAARLRAVGYGAGRPVADNATAAGRAANRRVEITIAAGSEG